ncbi:hypothetical protein KI387_001405 [Taxus chinensis]|uniref:DUF659 domain-containing protein n=1 Tax=Taxus chinensis TaxID=29808 RepID=A0AA38GX61_TAXCH|nr:hypothetical protein KI387_001405 [Taxus chinensis]
MEEMRSTWVSHGCSIIMDGWTDIRHHPLINIIVSCREGPYFLRAVDCSGKKKDAEFQFTILRDAIEEVGPANVVQVITDAAYVCRAAGKLVEAHYQHIYWTPCCVHAMNNALKDIGKIDWVKNVVADARDVQMFICNHHTSLALFRSFSRKEFLKPVDTRFASYFILLDRMAELQESLQCMVMTSEWSRWDGSKTEQGKKVKAIVVNETFWIDVRYITSIISPVFSVIKYGDSESPNLGEIYECIDSMLGQMKVVVRARDPTLEFYHQHIQPIIERRWEKLNTPLHMAAYALNPKWYVERPGRVLPVDDEEVRKGFLKALKKCIMQRMLHESELIGSSSLIWMATKKSSKIDRTTLAHESPVSWWRLYGHAGLLRTLAIRLLSQVSSSSASERNWSTYGWIHSLKRNRLTSKRAEKLVAVHSALRLMDRKTPTYKESPALRWDVDPEDARQVDEDQEQRGLVDISFADADDIDTDTPSEEERFATVPSEGSDSDF